jgi:hypothetical protein
LDYLQKLDTPALQVTNLPQPAKRIADREGFESYVLGVAACKEARS